MYRFSHEKGYSWKDFFSSTAFLDSTKEAVKTMLETGNETRYAAVRDPASNEVFISPPVVGESDRADGVSTRKGRIAAKSEASQGGKYLLLDMHFHPEGKDRAPLPIPSHEDLYLCDIQTRNFKGKRPVFGIGKYLEKEEGASGIDMLLYQRKKDTPYLSYLMSRLCQAVGYRRPYARKFRNSLLRKWHRDMREGRPSDPTNDVIKAMEKTGLYNVAYVTMKENGIFSYKDLDIFLR